MSHHIAHAILYSWRLAPAFSSILRLCLKVLGFGAKTNLRSPPARSLTWCLARPPQCRTRRMLGGRRRGPGTGQGQPSGRRPSAALSPEHVVTSAKELTAATFALLSESEACIYRSYTLHTRCPHLREPAAQWMACLRQIRTWRASTS